MKSKILCPKVVNLQRTLLLFLCCVIAIISSASAEERRPTVSLIYRFLPYQKLLVKQRQRTLPIVRHPRGEENQEITRDLERATPLIANGKLYCGTQWGYLVALDLKTASEEWIVPLDGSVLSAPAYEDGALFVGTRGGGLYALDASDGKLLWRFSTTAPLLSGPVVTADHVYFLTGNDILYCLDRKTGKRVWHWHRGMTHPISIFSSSTPLLYKNRVIVGLAEGGVIALNAQDGTLVWQADLQGGGGRFKDVDATPLLKDGIIYIPSFGGALYAIDAGSGEIQWMTGEGSVSSAAISSTSLYYGTERGELNVVERSSGKILKKVTLSEGSALGTPLVHGELLFVPSSSGKIFALQRETLDLVWLIDVGEHSGFLGSLILHEGYLYALSGHSHLYKISTASWRVPGRRSPKRQ